MGAGGSAAAVSAKLGCCDPADADRVVSHVRGVGLPSSLGELGRRFSAARLMAHMARDKKVQDGRLAFVLALGIGRAFSSREVPAEAVAAVLKDAGCDD